MVLGWILNNIYDRKSFRDELEYLEKILEHDGIELKLVHSLQKGLPLYITMMSGKIYVGFPNRKPNVKLTRHSLEIFPLASGYRKSETHELALTTNYFNAYRQIAKNSLTEVISSDFNVVIRADQIQSIGLFHSMYLKEESIIFPILRMRILHQELIKIKFKNRSLNNLILYEYVN